jgi:hypothetical protein
MLLRQPLLAGAIRRSYLITINLTAEYDVLGAGYYARARAASRIFWALLARSGSYRCVWDSFASDLPH